MFFIEKFSKEEKERMQETMEKHGVKLFVDEDGSELNEIGDSVLLIEQRKWADCFYRKMQKSNKYMMHE